MLPVECVVRGYITGSGWKDYQPTGAVCGIELPAGPARVRAAARADLHAVDEGRGRPRRGDRLRAARSSCSAATARWPSACATSRSRSTRAPPSTRARAGDPRRHEVRARPATRTATLDARRRGAARPTPRASGRPTGYEPGSGAAELRQAVRARLGVRAPAGTSTPPAPRDPRRRRRAHAREVRRGVRADRRRAVRRLAGADRRHERACACWSGRRQGSSTRRARRSSGRCPRSASRASSNVHVGRLVELDVEDPARLPEMCERLLANPLIEDYEIVVAEPIDGVPRAPMQVRRRPLPRLLRRGRRAAGVRARRRGRAPLARRPRPAGRRRGRSSPAASPTATTCASARSRGSRR